MAELETLGIHRVPLKTAVDLFRRLSLRLLFAPGLLRRLPMECDRLLVIPLPGYGAEMHTRRGVHDYVAGRVVDGC